ncbi:MAG TPA: carboxymuconolactone decarboxylase family protein [Xanthobacteraceae bacterium]|jgi:4-carboxymuconolactone decarboxylase|nr:carboxymuconolactone decarboxylase family protein [Xanthobacteraceae bacterium]
MPNENYTRLAPPDPAQYTAEQKQAADAFTALRKEPPFGPFGLMLHSPRLMENVQRLGEYLRYHSSIGQKLSELAVLITARECSQDYEWFLHQPIAVKAGVRQEITDAIRDGKRPEGMTGDEALVYDVSMELHRTKNISDALYQRAIERFGAQGVTDLIGTNGYYALLAMQLNAHRMPLPEGAPGLPKLR